MPTQNSPETIVMSVGGSMIVPDQIDTTFLTKLRELVETEIATGKRFVIITGGGKVCRTYQNAARELGCNDNNELDWIGIAATKINASLVHSLFHETAYAHVVVDPSEISDIPETESLIIASGFEPGNSSDYQAVQLAALRNADKMINLSNTDYVYTADPRTNPEAEKIEDITWAEFRTLIPEEWDPGLSSPFDPVAARLAEEKHIEVANINGQKLDELQNYINGRDFVGTRIHSE
ncbi:UMP kinase [Candidatus Pacebacteria bacterium]|nr:UMP kinase [Candidatus Paceibacterota bacterium]